MKRVLITGKNSYVGTAVENWLLKNPDQYAVDTLDMRDTAWATRSFSKYDVVFHVAGIAHVSTDRRMKELYYIVNRDLAIETAEKAKAEGVKQFIFMSTILVYGDSRSKKVLIDRNTVPAPRSFYGESKLQAEQGIISMQSESFKIVVIRAPMIYGKGSKGNYPRLATLAKRTPMFPDFDNERSMLHIDNLCQFVEVMIAQEESGLFFPQNAEYVKTSGMVKAIAAIHGRKVWLTRIFNPLVSLLCSVGVVNKAFGSLVYDESMSAYDKAKYRIRTFDESIERTER